MKKIYLPKNSKQSLGGGFSFFRNITKVSTGLFEIVDTWQECDIVLITGVTMTDREEMEKAARNGKKIILRVDNMPKDSRNRGTAFSRMKDFSMMADFIIFQSNWAKDYVGKWMIKQGVPAMKFDSVDNVVIYNGVDTDFFFYTDTPEDREEMYLYVQYNRDENKRYPEAFYDFHHISRSSSLRPRLKIVGNFSQELIENNFDFFDGEIFSYSSPVDNPIEMGEIMRRAKYLYFPAFADASPNTVSEALACGCQVLLVNPIGGTQEVIDFNYDWLETTGRQYSIKDMAKCYNAIFNSLT